MKKASVFLTLSVAFGCAEGEGETVLPAIDYVQVFGQEFDGADGDAIDTSIWNFDIGTGPNGSGWGNNELQYYTDSTENVSLDGDGNLRIRAREIPPAERSNFENRAYSSGRITTLRKFEQKYGRFEARMKMPRGRGMWPAFWMLGSNFPEEGWPVSGEIDIMEFNSGVPTVIFGSVHGPGYNGGNAISAAYARPVEAQADDGPPRFVRWDDDFHTFAVEWDPSRIAWYVDDDLYGVVTGSTVQASAESNCVAGLIPEADCERFDRPTRWPFDQPFFLILNFAVGGNFVLNQTPLPGELPQEFLIDYVRVFDRTSLQ